MKLKKVAVFASGSGSNFQSIIDENKKAKFCDLVLLIASKQDTYAQVRARENGIDSLVFSKSDYKDSKVMFEKIARELNLREVDFLVLAGYLTILPPEFIQEFEGRIINIHPSLLPKFGGDGFYGLKVHSAVLEANEKKSGCTVHFVSEQVDGGAIIMQSEVDVFDNDTPTSLQERVLKKEHELLPAALKKLCLGKAALIGEKAVIKE